MNKKSFDNLKDRITGLYKGRMENFDFKKILIKGRFVILD